MSKDPRLFDLRSVEKNIEKGLITQAEYKKYLVSLPDESENLELISLEDDGEEDN